MVSGMLSKGRALGRAVYSNNQAGQTLQGYSSGSYAGSYSASYGGYGGYGW